MAYFKAAGWDQDWINTAQDIVREQFESRYSTQIGLRLGANNMQDANNLKDTSQIKSLVCIEMPYML